MKKLIQEKLQYLLGYKLYLFIFCLFKCFQIRFEKESEDFFYFLKLIPKQGAILDIGANLGFLTFYFSKKAGNNKVFAFEPIKENYTTLINIVKIFRLKNVECFNVALGDVEKEVNMITPIVNGIKKQGLSKVIKNLKNYKGEHKKYTVKQKSLDDMEELRGVKIAAIKIDVENYEYFVLKGGISLIRKYMPLIYCELWQDENFKQCKSLLEETGYSVFYYKDKKLCPHKSNESTSESNFFFIPPLSYQVQEGKSPKQKSEETLSLNKAKDNEYLKPAKPMS